MGAVALNGLTVLGLVTKKVLGLHVKSNWNHQVH